MQSRTTIVVSDRLIKHVSEYAEKNGTTMSEFISKAILNQFEKEGDFEIRDKMLQEEIK